MGDIDGIWHCCNFWGDTFELTTLDDGMLALKTLRKRFGGRPDLHLEASSDCCWESAEKARFHCNGKRFWIQYHKKGKWKAAVRVYRDGLAATGNYFLFFFVRQEQPANVAQYLDDFNRHVRHHSGSTEILDDDENLTSRMHPLPVSATQQQSDEDQHSDDSSHPGDKDGDKDGDNDASKSKTRRGIMDRMATSMLAAATRGKVQAPHQRNTRNRAANTKSAVKVESAIVSPAPPAAECTRSLLDKPKTQCCGMTSCSMPRIPCCIGLLQAPRSMLPCFRTSKTAVEVDSPNPKPAPPVADVTRRFSLYRMFSNCCFCGVGQMLTGRRST